MTLSKQLILLVATLVLLLLLTSLVINIHNARIYLAEQLGSHAQDTATSLGLSATSHIASGDEIMVQSMTDALFDRGDYVAIRIERADGTPWVERTTGVMVYGVPVWFVELVPLQAPVGSATVMSGWHQVGTVTVESHPGHAYQQLWANSRISLLWFLLGAGLILGLSLLVLRAMLRPLKRVEAQADAICNREFPINRERPATHEFRRVVEALNRLSGKVQKMLGDAERSADQFRQQAYQDPVTGLPNQRHFLELLQHRIADEERQLSGALLILQLKDFKQYNQRHGHAEGDRLLQATAESLQKRFGDDPTVLLARLTGADFALLLQQHTVIEIGTIAGQVIDGVIALHGYLPIDVTDVGHVGGVIYRGQLASELLASADQALRQAQTEGANQWRVLGGSENGVIALGAEQWRERLLKALAEDAFHFVRQPIYACGEGGKLLHHELFLRLHDEGEVSAGTFIPMAINCGLAVELDRWSMARALADSVVEELPITLNISPQTLGDSDTLNWLQQQIVQQSRTGSGLILEVPEYGANIQLDELNHWIATLVPLGVRFSLDDFGRGFSAFSYLRNLKVHFIKLDGSLILDLDQSPDNQFYIESICRIAHGLDIEVLAESVESEAVWEVLQQLGVDGGRGYWLGRPE